MLTYLINGQTDTRLHVTDRGLSYGDGLFETILVREGVPLLWEAHLWRMKTSAKRLKICFAPSLAADFREDLLKLIGASSKTGVLKLMLTRGETQRGYKIDDNAAVTRIAILSPAPDLEHLTRDGISVVLCRTQLARQPLLAGIKHLNRLEQVLARSEWQQSEITEGIVCDTRNHVIEGCMSNLFWVKNGTLYTPDLSLSGVEGVVRNLVVELCEQHQLLQVRSGFYNKDDLFEADEIFVTNSVFNILAVVNIAADYSLQDRLFSPLIFNYGPVTKVLQSLLQQYYLRKSV